MRSSQSHGLEKPAFLAGVFLISFAMLVFQIVQTRILSVIAWYYLAFFAISVAMLGMTLGAVLVYLRRDLFEGDRITSALSDSALLCAVSMPASVLVQLSLITSLLLSLTTVVSWSLLLAAMAVPYVFAGVVVSLALTRSPFPVSQVYAVDLLGAALGCVAVVLILNLISAPSTIVVAGSIAGLSALCFSRAGGEVERQRLRARSRFLRPSSVTAALVLFAVFNATSPVGIRPTLVKDRVEGDVIGRSERWNSYSRIIAGEPVVGPPKLWGASPKLPPGLRVEYAFMNIDGEAGTDMFHYDGTRGPLEFLSWDLVNLAYTLPDIHKAAIIGVGGGRDILSAHFYGVNEIVGVELNPILVDLHLRDPVFSKFSNLGALPNLKIFVDDARSWFASTEQRFDLVQMSMIDTWAATGAGAFSLSENGLYTLEGWRAFIGALNDGGVLTVSRWYHPGDVNEAGRMIALATAAVLDMGLPDARPHLFVARTNRIATLVLSKRPLTAVQISGLKAEVERLGLDVLLAPDQAPASALLAAIVASKDIDSLNEVAGQAYLDLTVPTDDRPFFFNQLRFSRIPEAVQKRLSGDTDGGVLQGNLQATGALVVILLVSVVAVICTIVLPLRGVTRRSSLPLVAAGSAYFSLIGIGFMLAEIGLLQYFSVYLGHPIYSLSVCLFSLILATGLGSLASDRFAIVSRRAMVIWALVVGGYLLGVQAGLTDLFHATTGRALPVRIIVSLAVIMPLGLLLGFAFPTGIKLVEAVDPEPTPWFWGINGVAGVLASTLAVMLSMAFGIRVTLSVAGLCYLCLIPAALFLIALGKRKAALAA